MNNESQVQVIKQALDLEREISRINAKLNKLQSSSFEPAPPEPHYSKVDREYPEVTSKLKYWPIAIVGIILSVILCGYGVGNSFRDANTTLVVIGLLLPFFLIILYLPVFERIKAASIERQRKSEAFQSRIREIDREYDLMDSNALSEYVKAKAEYDEKVLPAYEKRKNDWEIKIARDIMETKAQLSSVRNKLNDIYAESKLIPSNYHNIPALSYLYDLMSTSQYDIKEAIEKYDRDEARRWDQQHKLELERAANEQAEAAWQTAETAEKARRDQNRANTIAAIQRYNTNKQLRNLNRK